MKVLKLTLLIIVLEVVVAALIAHSCGVLP